MPEALCDGWGVAPVIQFSAPAHLDSIVGLNQVSVKRITQFRRVLEKVLEVPLVHVLSRLAVLRKFALFTGHKSI